MFLIHSDALVVNLGNIFGKKVSIFCFLFHFYILTPWCSIFFEHIIVIQLVKKFPAFMELDGSLMFTEALHWTLS
jgi:hypothetical protein